MLNKRRLQSLASLQLYCCLHKRCSQRYCNVEETSDGTLLHDGIVTKKGPDCVGPHHLKAEIMMQLEGSVRLNLNTVRINCYYICTSNKHLANFSVFGNRMNHCLSCLIYHTKVDKNRVRVVQSATCITFLCESQSLIPKL